MIIFNIIIGLIGLGLVVTVHEFGHLLAAKCTGIGVDVFSVGWGRKLIGRRIGATEYRISLFPIGGFVRLKGEHALLQAHRERRRAIAHIPGGFFSASPWKRVVVAFGGPVANLIMALVVFTIIYSIGYQFQTYSNRVVIAPAPSVDQSVPAERAGLQDGDRIIEIDGVSVGNFHDIRDIILDSDGNALRTIYTRDGVHHTTTLTPEINSSTGIAQIGIFPWIDLEVAGVEAGSAADIAGLALGDTLLSANGVEVQNTIDLATVFEDSAELTLRYQRNGIERTATLVLEGRGSQVAGTGLSFGVEYARVPSLNIFSALVRSGSEIGRVFRFTVIGVRALFGGAEVTNVVAGPIRLTSTIGEVATASIGEGVGAALRVFFNFLSLISVALAIMNLLPIPVLDGGQILLYLTESVIGRRFSPRLIVRYQFIGSIMIAALLVLALASDAFYLIRPR